MPHPTDLQESKALLHVAEGQEEEAREILEKMSTTELNNLCDTAYRLGEICEEIIHGRV